MAEPPFNALQAILVRERLILYLQHRRQAERRFSVRKLIEAIVFSDANADKQRGYQEDADLDDRYDRGMPLKNNTIGNLITRKASATDAENLPLIRDFLLAEGFVSPRLLVLNAGHPDAQALRHFAGIAPTDPRLQKHRASIEGEYVRGESQSIEQLWIAAPGRSKPFITLRAITSPKLDAVPNIRPDLKAFNLDTASSLKRSEGRVFMMPGDTITLVEISFASRAWDGRVYRVEVGEHGIVLQNDLHGPVLLERLTPIVCVTSQRSTYDPKDAPKTVYAYGRRSGPEVQLATAGVGARIFKGPKILKKAASNRQLINAAKTGDAYGVLDALVNGADINHRDRATGRTAMHWAAAANSLESVYILAPPSKDDALVLARCALKMRLSRTQVAAWRKGASSRKPLSLDNEHCLASACAPITTDGTERNRRATEIWHHLICIEARRFMAKYNTSPFGLLEIWQPSSVMKEAARLYSPKLPPGS